MHSKSAGFPEFRKKLDKIKALVEEEQMEIWNKKNYKEVKKVTTTTRENFKSHDRLKILKGVLVFGSSLFDLFYPDKSLGIICWALSTVVDMFIMKSKPNQPSVVHELTKVFHDQKYGGLKLRMSEQIFQFQGMKGEKLDDPTLWNDYVQFLGELAIRFESPLPFMYEKKLTKDPNVKDFVTAIVKYSEAFSSFMVLAVVKYSKVRIAELLNDTRNTTDPMYRKIIFQMQDAKEKLSFLSEERYLTFLGKIDDGKLTKIVALSRRIRDRSLVETVRHNLGLSPMPNLTTVESSAKKVSQQAVTLRPIPECNSYFCPYHYFNTNVSIQFFNEVDVPMKIVSGEVGESQGNQFQFEQIVEPRKSYRQKTDFSFSTGGYIVLYFNSSMVSSDLENTRVIGFAVSHGCREYKIGMQDKTEKEFSGGQDALDESSAHPVTLYFSENGKYYIAKAEYFFCRPNYTFRFIIQDFDPEAVGDGEH